MAGMETLPPTGTSSGDHLRLFVYGTLMRDGCRHRVLAGQPFLGAARTQPHYDLLDLKAYPGLIRCESKGRMIEGELYEVTADLVPVLDRIEGAPTLFRLESVELEDGAGPVVAYFYQSPAVGLPRYPAGRWDNTRRG